MNNTIRKTIIENVHNVKKNQSLLLYNLKTDKDDNYEIRKQKEFKKINDILKNTEINYKITNYYRIGKYDDNINIFIVINNFPNRLRKSLINNKSL